MNVAPRAIISATRRNHDYAIVPGLADLHARLAFNNEHHLFGALLSLGP
jgi:hypothetical protein